jgi:hypothetical protein
MVLTHNIGVILWRVRAFLQSMSGAIIGGRGGELRRSGR